MNLNLFYQLQHFENTIGDTSSTRHKKRNEPIVISAFQDLLQISPDIFQEFVRKSVIKKPVLAKEKSECNMEKTPGLIESEWEIVEKEREEEILNVEISTHGRIIRNTRKMELYNLILAQSYL